MRVLIFILSAIILIPAKGQTGPGGIGSTDGTSTLKMWLDAGKSAYSDTLTKRLAQNSERLLWWQDLSGSKNDVIARTDSTRPQLVAGSPLFNGASGIRFSRNAGKGNRRNYLESKTFSATSSITIFVVFNATSSGGGNNVTPFTYKGTTGNDTMWYAGAGLVDADVYNANNDVSMTITDTSLAAGGGDFLVKTDYTVKTPIRLNTTLMGCLKRDHTKGLLSISKNGSTSSDFPIGNQPINNAIKYTIGATSNSINGNDNNFFDGHMASVLVYNKILNAAEQVIVENYLSAKFGLSLSANDLYKSDEESAGHYDFELAGIGRGLDGIAHTKSQGEGILELSNPAALKRGEYVIWAHNGQPMTYQLTDVPEGAKQRLIRTWKAAVIGQPGKVDLVLDTRTFNSPELSDLILLVDTDNNGSFENELLGNGMIVHSKYLGNGKYLFPQVSLPNEAKFTFGTLKPACKQDCEAVFTPNGDGISDTYYISAAGKTVILDKYGQVIRQMHTPAFWDGSNAQGTIVKEGLYFLLNDDSSQKTVTVIR